MRGKRKGSRLAGALTALLGFVCALILGALFYGTMVYQFAGEDGQAETGEAAEQAVTQVDGLTFPGQLLALSEGELTDEQAAQETVDGVHCAVVTRTYTLADGTQVFAVSASSTAYMARLAEAGYTPQLVTGFSVAGLSAVCEARGQEMALAARDGECVYLIAAQASEQTMYALGASSLLEE